MNSLGGGDLGISNRKDGVRCRYEWGGAAETACRV